MLYYYKRTYVWSDNLTSPLEKSCCFTGHRRINEDFLTRLVERLNLEIDYMISIGVQHFYTGGALGFDTLAALAVLLRKQKGADIFLHLMLPCPGQTKYWSERDINIYNDILARADSVTTLSEHYHGGVMQIRNRAMIDACNYCICFFDKQSQSAEKNSGGTLYTVNYARKLGRKTVNLWDEPPEDIQLEFEF